MVSMINLGELVLNGTQTRAEVRWSTVNEYASLLAEGVEFPPVVAFDEGGILRLSSGFHRFRAYKKAGRQTIPCDVRQGSRWDAIAFGIRDNLQHQGERLTRADRRKGIEMALQEQPTWSDSTIADLCGASDKTVARVRRELEATSEIPRSSIRTAKDGRTFDVQKLGRAPVQKHATTLLPAIGDRCPCGCEWISDGEGGRFCDGCGATHPETPSVVYDNAVEPMVANAPKTVPLVADEAVDLFKQLYECLGQMKKRLDALNCIRTGSHYRVALGHLNQASDTITAWVKAEGLVDQVIHHGRCG